LESIQFYLLIDVQMLVRETNPYIWIGFSNLCSVEEKQFPELKAYTLFPMESRASMVSCVAQNKHTLFVLVLIEGQPPLFFTRGALHN
jgi:hypothetical protein